MSSLPEATQSLTQVFNNKLLEFTNEINNEHMVWLQEIQQEAQRMFSSDFSTEPELMPRTPSQKKTNRRKPICTEPGDARNKRRFSKGKRSNLRRSSMHTTLNSISESKNIPSDVPELLTEEPVRRTRRNKGGAAADSEPVTRSTRNKGAAKAKEQEVEVEKELEAAVENVFIQKEEEVDAPQVEVSESLSPVLVSEVVVKIPSVERLSAEKLLQVDASPSRSVQKIPIAAASRTSSRHSLVVRRSLAVIRHSMTQEAVRRASRRSFLKKKARMGNSTCSSTVSGDVSVDMELEEAGDMIENPIEHFETAKQPVEASTAAPSSPPKEPQLKNLAVVKAINVNSASPSAEENCRVTRSRARGSESDAFEEKPQDADGASRSGAKRVAEVELPCTPKKKRTPPKKCMTTITPALRSFQHTVQKNQLLMMTPSSLGRSSILKSFIKQSGKVDVKERERQKWDALNKKIEQENERKKKVEEEKRRKQEEMKRKRDERLKRVVEARVKGEKEKEQEKKKKMEEKFAQLERKNDMMREEKLAVGQVKKMVASKRQEELELRRKQEEAARKKKLQQAEETERRHLELLAKRKAEEEREKARKQAEAARALEIKKEQERQAAAERERLEKLERERLEKERLECERLERERLLKERLEREMVEKEKALALQKELERAAKEKERKALEEKRRMEENQKREEEERAAQQKRAAAAASATSVVHVSTNKALNATFTCNPKLNATVDIESSVMMTPVSKGAAHNQTVDKGAGMNVTADIEQSPQSYEITPKGKKVEVLVNPEDYGMDLNSDDSTDDESDPRKPIPSWAEGMQLHQTIKNQYHNPLDLYTYFGNIEAPRLEEIFQKNKPRFFKRTSSAVWHSPPRMEAFK